MSETAFINITGRERMAQLGEALYQKGYDLCAAVPMDLPGTYYLVLAFNKHKNEWVTWRTNPPAPGYDLDFYWGSYYRTYNEALRGFTERAEKLRLTGTLLG